MKPVTFFFSFRHEDGSSRDEEGSMGPGVSRSIKVGSTRGVQGLAGV